MTHVGLRVAGVLAGLAIAGCASSTADQAALAPSRTTPVAHKQRTLATAEFPAMRAWIIGDGSTIENLQPVCDGLDAAPATPVVRATRNACDRVMSVLIDIRRVLQTIRADCTGDIACVTRLLRGPYRNDYRGIRRILATYIDDIVAVMAPGPCRNVLAPKDALSKVDGELKKFDAAVDELANGNSKAFDVLDSEDGHLDDPAPCRPT